MIPSLAYHIAWLNRDFVAYCSARLRQMGLTVGLLYFVLYVGKHPGCSPGQLAQALHMDGGHAARCLTKLEQGGFLSQQPHPQDRRAHILQLTPAGQRAFEASHQLFYDWDAQALAGLEPAQRLQLLELLQSLAARQGGLPHV